ncbi:hypothetical protein FB451DRAFT_1128205 [Mycena latifolia]|nr:hypothetical protein FB451DRAFT_1128205 [Mycena latifolia]
MSFALAYGSFGDIAETVRLAIRIAQILHNGGQTSEERQELILELRTLSTDLVTLSQLASKLLLDSSSGQYQMFVQRICADVEACRGFLRRSLEKISVRPSVLKMIGMALSEKRDLAEFKAKISKHQDSLRMWQTMLSLAVAQEMSNQVRALGSRVENVGNELQSLGKNLSACSEMILHPPVSHGVRDDMIFVTGYTGAGLSVSLRYCNSYEDLDRIIKASFHRCTNLGAEFVQSGDYKILLPERHIISPQEFPRVMKPGAHFEMSITVPWAVQWQQGPASDECPHCGAINDFSECQRDHLRESLRVGCTCDQKCFLRLRLQDPLDSTGRLVDTISPVKMGPGFNAVLSDETIVPADENQSLILGAISHHPATSSYVYNIQQATMPSVETMDEQPEIQWHMRPILVDFLLEIHQYFMLRPETLHLALTILNRYVSRRVVFVKHYQLLGCAALRLAAEFEEAEDCVPTVDDLSQTCVGIYEEDAFIQMQEHILGTIKSTGTLGHPTAAAWLRVMSLGPSAEDEKVRHVAYFLLDMTLFYREYIQYSPSSIAVAVLTLARFLCGYPQRPWEETAEASLVVDLLDVRLAEYASDLSVILVKKYSYELYFKVAVFVLRYYLEGGRYTRRTSRGISLVVDDFELGKLSNLHL